ncbi:ubiquinol-cytochrome c reductase iron-sulfur subunit [Psychrobacter sp. LV10R520-6]|uniref:ubiquinol-cytochrome c reductase iron-sulfur subunit n=1 Tax=Psychrobacter sp. LV10R520-6 TaxID=1415574 RepID=UPI0024CCD24B|nr:ubiquinol-cytochrome c reductase iron-sulfur subunit [Psychrobacter sp. LV10R520-6]SNT70125.1 ubiquinol-cytochrome c reductase iron-sulfur subunit [Psychrobacter sp. LV10R520-6]
MSQAEGVNVQRRRVLIATTAAIGAVGVAAVATPFVRSWTPSARAEAAGAAITQDIGSIEEGQMIVLKYRGKPTYVVKRTQDMLDKLDEVKPLLVDPDSSESVQPEYCTNPTRSLEPTVLVVYGVCTHLGCAPNYRPDVGAADLGGNDWYGGFFCPCHGSKYDLAGRVYSGVPAPLNLPIPEYSMDGTILTVGEA